MVSLFLCTNYFFIQYILFSAANFHNYNITKLHHPWPSSEKWLLDSAVVFSLGQFQLHKARKVQKYSENASSYVIEINMLTVFMNKNKEFSRIYDWKITQSQTTSRDVITCPNKYRSQSRCALCDRCLPNVKIMSKNYFPTPASGLRPTRQKMCSNVSWNVFLRSLNYSRQRCMMLNESRSRSNQNCGLG